ncbi:hypothetical protein CHELA1G11_50067 [Hyphomicrobiales bacterium]|nr:hypothetical protein CHELA1G11_50067 [Hyphomicrobiales bacterium]
MVRRPLRPSVWRASDEPVLTFLGFSGLSRRVALLPRPFSTRRSKGSPWELTTHQLVISGVNLTRQNRYSYCGK